MYFAQPWGLLGLLAIPAIVVIHMYHHRFPPLVIGGSHLWGVEEQKEAPGRKRSKLPITASLLFELLAAALISLIVADPRFDRMNQVTHWVVVLDQTASMSARHGEKISFRNDAIKELKKRWDDFGRDTVVTLILTGPRPTMLAGPAVPVDVALPALDQWQPRSPHHDYHPAWDLASQFAGETGRLLFLTDHIPADTESIPPQMEVVSLGRKLENLAFTAARWTYDSKSSTGKLYLRIANFGRNAHDVQLTGQAANRPVFDQKLKVAAGQELPFEAPLPGGIGRLTLKIAAQDDALALDDELTLVEPKVRSVAVHLGLPAESAARPALQRVLAQLDDVNFTDAKSSQLMIAPAESTPAANAEQWWLGVGPLDPEESAVAKSRNLAGPYLIDKRHPLLEGVLLEGVICGGVQTINKAVTPLISVGKVPVFAQLDAGESDAYLLNLDMQRSNIGESPDWPILISNLIEHRRRELPGLQRWNYRLGETVQFHWPLPELAANRSSSIPELSLIHRGESRPIARSE
ncbi:MAG: BatA domain-containing protein [Planctomycetaceae bacterium]